MRSVADRQETFRQHGCMKAVFNSFQEVQEYLAGLGLFYVDLSLGRVRRALAALKITRPPFVTVQVLGTNGKGSTASFLASLCTAHGCRTGLYTSPHFVSPTERIRVDGRPVPEGRWVSAANELMQTAAGLTYFEWLTVLALLLFIEDGVEAAILEAGLGGRYDATTGVDADLLCFTPIAVDHRELLGASLRQIAGDKAAAVRSAAPVVSAQQFPDAARCISEAARAHNAPLYAAEALSETSPLKPGMAGPHQLVNAGLALAAWRHLAPMLKRDADNTAGQALGLKSAFLPGRLQPVTGTREYPDLLLDGAHNPHGMRALLNALHQADIHPACAVFSCLADKDCRTSALLLKRCLGNVPFFVPTLQNPRAASAQHVAQVCNTLLPLTTLAVHNLAAALHAAEAVRGVSAECPVLLTGSLYLLAEFFTLYPAALAVPALLPENSV